MWGVISKFDDSFGVISYDIFHDKPFFIIKIPGSANIKIKKRPIFINYQKGNGLYLYIFFFHNVN